MGSYLALLSIVVVAAAAFIAWWVLLDELLEWLMRRCERFIARKCGLDEDDIDKIRQGSHGGLDDDD